ncbi:MAG: response regulator, partial [Candidatus Aminicenantes bacterium]|nr:response regulator [Candidatus Aminicenantes bacterium]
MKMRVFIVEDYVDIVRPLMDNFRMLGHEVEFILDSRNAVQNIIHFKPDWLILDIRMPYKNGLDVFKELKGKADIRFKVVFYSLYFDDPKILKGLNDLRIPDDIRIAKSNDYPYDVNNKIIPALEAG